MYISAEQQIDFSLKCRRGIIMDDNFDDNLVLKFMSIVFYLKDTHSFLNIKILLRFFQDEACKSYSVLILLVNNVVFLFSYVLHFCSSTILYFCFRTFCNSARARRMRAAFPHVSQQVILSRLSFVFFDIFCIKNELREIGVIYFCIQAISTMALLDEEKINYELVTVMCCSSFFCLLLKKYFAIMSLFLARRIGLVRNSRKF